MSFSLSTISGEITPDRRERILQYVLEHSGDYEWMHRMLRARSRRRDGNMPFNSFRRLHFLGNPRKPYYVDELSDRTKFIGHFRDTESLFWSLSRSHSADVIATIVACLEARPGLYIDIGANTGVVASQISHRLNHEIDLIAFEAISETAVRAAATFALNKMSRARLFAMAVGDTDGELEMEIIPGSSGQSSAFRADNVQNLRRVERKSVKVPSMRLDSMAALLPPVRVVKIDVEGCEMRVLQGGRELIRRDRPDIVFEYNEAMAELAGWSIADARQLLTECCPDYRCFVIGSENGEIKLDDAPPPAGLSNIYCSVAPAL